MPTLSFKVPDDWPGFAFLIDAEKHGWTRSALLRLIVDEFLAAHGTDVLPVQEQVAPSTGSATLNTDALANAIAGGIVEGFKNAGIGNDISQSIKDGLKGVTLPIEINDGGHAVEPVPSVIRAKRPEKREAIIEEELKREDSPDDLESASNNFLSMFG